MTLVSKPNTWVAVDAAAATALAYAPRVHPAPWTVSLPERDPQVASLEVVITNQSARPVEVATIDFSFEVGPASSALTPTTAEIHTEVSDPSSWHVSGPPSPVTSGRATYTLGPVTGASATLAAGASVVVQLYHVQTGLMPGTATVNVKEIVTGQAPAFTSFAVTTFPDGFYFDGLVACVRQGSALAPVAQVAVGFPVVLVWSASVAEVGAVDIYYSNAASGQQHAKPTTFGEWVSPALAGDTTFVVEVTASGAGGAPLTAALATGVSVQNPKLIATSVRTGHAEVTGAATIEGQLTAERATVAGGLAAGTAAISGSLSAASATVDGAFAAHGVTDLTTLTVQGAAHAGSITAGKATVTSAFDATKATVGLLSGSREIRPGTYVANTDLLLVGASSLNKLVAAKTDDIEVGAPNGSFTLPVAAGHQYKVYDWGLNTGKYYVVPLGSAPVAQAFDRIGEAPAGVAPELLGERAKAAVDVAGVLERILEKPVAPEHAAELIDSLRQEQRAPGDAPASQSERETP